MNAIVSQITGVSIVCSAVCSGAEKIKPSTLRVTSLCEGNSLVIGEFSAQRASDAEQFLLDDVIMLPVITGPIDGYPYYRCYVL